MRCTDKEREACQVEKLGCKGCAYYDGISLEKVEKAKEFLKQEIINSYSEKKAAMLDIIYKYISELETNNYEQNNIINNYIEIEKEHQELVGELIEENKILKEQKK